VGGGCWSWWWPVGTPVRWERAVHREGRAAVSFAFLDKWIYFKSVFPDYKNISDVIA
jgi:hypothetical protein